MNRSRHFFFVGLVSFVFDLIFYVPYFGLLLLITGGTPDRYPNNLITFKDVFIFGMALNLILQVALFVPIWLRKLGSVDNERVLVAKHVLVFMVVDVLFFGSVYFLSRG